MSAPGRILDAPPPPPDQPEWSWRAVTIITGVLLAVLPTIYLHLAAVGRIDPVSQPISDYIAVPGGRLLLAVSMGALALAAAALNGGLAARPGARPVRVLLICWQTALTVAAVFPTNRPGTPSDLAADLHRCAAVVICAALPAACWSLARCSRSLPGWAGSATVLHRLAISSGAAGAALFIAQLLPTDAAALAAIGLLQRALLALQVTALITAACAVQLAHRHVQSRSAEAP